MARFTEQEAKCVGLGIWASSHNVIILMVIHKTSNSPGYDSPGQRYAEFMSNKDVQIINELPSFEVPKFG